MPDDLPAPDDPCWHHVRPSRQGEQDDLDRPPVTEPALPPLLAYDVWRARAPYALTAAVGWFFVFPVPLGGSFGVGLALLAGAVSTWVLLGRRAPVQVEGYAVLVLVPIMIAVLLAT